jgi:CheY-like chemotaxis protein
MAARPLILIVDDEPTIRALLADILGELGYEVLSAETGEAAVPLFERRAGEVALAIVDLVLPGQSGLETVRALRARRSALPAIISTGYEDTRPREGRTLREIARIEGFGVLEKPYKVDALASAVEAALGGPGAAAAGQPT